MSVFLTETPGQSMVAIHEANTAIKWPQTITLSNLFDLDRRLRGLAADLSGANR